MRLECALCYLVYLDLWYIPLIGIFPDPKSPPSHAFQQPEILLLLPLALIWLIHLSWMLLLAVDFALFMIDRSAPYRPARYFLYVALITLFFVKALLIHKMASI